MLFGLVKNAKSAHFLKGNFKIAWDKLVIKYAPHAASFLLKFKSEFYNSKLESMEKDPDEWILHLEWLQIWMNKFRQKGNKAIKDFMINILNNLPEDHDVILDGIENCLTATGDDALTINNIREKLNHWYKKINSKKTEEEKSLGAYEK